MSYSNDAFLRNIDVRRNELNYKVGDLEKKLNVSPGYFSRLSKNSESLPNTELVMKASEVLDISMDILLKYDLLGITKTDKYLNVFIRKLLEDTIAGRVEWIEEKSIIDQIPMESSDSEKFYGEAAYTYGVLFKTQVKKEEWFTIRPLFFERKTGRYNFLELRLRDDISKYPSLICSSCKTHNCNQTAMNELYNYIFRKREDFKLSSKVKNSIESYLKTND